MSLLSYEEVAAITYRSSDIGIRLTKEQQSLLIQVAALFNDGSLWTDYDDYRDDIDALVAASEYALQVEESYPVIGTQTQFQLWCGWWNALDGSAISFNVPSAIMPPVASQTPASGNVIVYRDLIIPAGIYRFKWHTLKSTQSGKASVLLWDGVEGHDNIDIEDEVDFYNSVTLANYIYESDEFTVPTEAEYTLYVTTTGKNASSGNYNIYQLMSLIYKVSDL